MLSHVVPWYVMKVDEAFLLVEDPICEYFLKSSFTLLYKQMYFKIILAKAPYRKLNYIQC